MRRSNSSNNYGVSVLPATNSISFRVPASTSNSAINVYVAPYIGPPPAGSNSPSLVGQLVAQLSDGSAPPFVQEFGTGTSCPGSTKMTIGYSSGTANQTLLVTVSYVGGNIAPVLQAADAFPYSNLVPSAPALTATANSNGSITLSWNSQTPTPTYSVYRGTSSTSQPSTYIGSGTNQFEDGNVTMGTTYYYMVVAQNTFGQADSNVVSATANEQPPAVNSPISAPGTVGVPFGYTITATNIPTSFGAVGVNGQPVSTDLPAGLTLNPSTGLISGTPTQAITQNVTVTATNAGGTGTETVQFAIAPGQATHLSVSAPASVTIGSPFSLTVSELDQYNNVTYTDQDAMTLSSSDTAASLPSAFNLLPNGSKTVQVTLNTTGNQTVTASDPQNSNITAGSTTIFVSAHPATHFALAAPTGAASGQTFGLIVAALDANNNIATGYTGTVHFTSTDPNATLPQDAQIENGTGVLSVTAALQASGLQTITATDKNNTSLSGTSDIYVFGFTFSGIPPCL